MNTLVENLNSLKEAWNIEAENLKQRADEALKDNSLKDYEFNMGAYHGLKDAIYDVNCILQRS